MSNNDISFSFPDNDNNNKSFENIKDILGKPGIIIGLSRYNLRSQNKIEMDINEWSQDSWSFKAPIKVPENSDFYFGKWRCDCRMIQLFSSEGYTCVNPLGSVVSIHWHLSDVRTYHSNSAKDIIEGLCKSLKPDTIITNPDIHKYLVEPVSGPIEHFKSFTSKSTFFTTLLILLIILIYGKMMNGF